MLVVIFRWHWFVFALPRVGSLPERTKLGPEELQKLDTGSIVTLEREGGGFILVKRLRGSDYGVALEFPGPDNKRIRIATYAVNWATEFFIVAILVFFWVRPFWRDLLKLREGAEAVGAGRFDQRVALRRGSPLRTLAEGFNAMTGKIAGLLQSHRGLTSSVSHELRTPLARLKFSHSLAREEPRPEGKDRYLALMERDIAELDELTSELLDYARLERGVPEIKVQSVPAEPWLEDLIADARQTGGVGLGNPFYDITAFKAIPSTEARFGNMSLNELRGPRLALSNLGIFRSFTVSERFNLQFRGEALNWTNTPGLNNPNANVSAQANFMAITSAATGLAPQRTMRFGLRLAF